MRIKSIKTAIAVLLFFSVLFTAVSAAGTADTFATAEPTDALPEDTDLSEDLTKTFLNINIRLFTAALAVFIVCTVGLVIYRIKKKRSV